MIFLLNDGEPINPKMGALGVNRRFRAGAEWGIPLLIDQCPVLDLGFPTSPFDRRFVDVAPVPRTVRHGRSRWAPRKLLCIRPSWFCMPGRRKPARATSGLPPLTEHTACLNPVAYCRVAQGVSQPPTREGRS